MALNLESKRSQEGSLQNLEFATRRNQTCLVFRVLLSLLISYPNLCGAGLYCLHIVHISCLPVWLTCEGLSSLIIVFVYQTQLVSAF